MLGKLPGPRRDIVGKGPTAQVLMGVVLDVFSHLSNISSVPFSPGDLD